MPLSGHPSILSLRLSDDCGLSVELSLSCQKFYVMYTESFKNCLLLCDGIYGIHMKFMALLLAKRKIVCVSFVTMWLKLSPEFLSILVFCCIKVGLVK